MSKKSKSSHIKRKAPEPQNQLDAISPKSSSQQLHELVEVLLNNEWYAEEFIERIMLTMLIVMKLYSEPEGREWFNSEEKRSFMLRTATRLADNQSYKSLLTDTQLVETLLTNRWIIEMVYDYILDPIKLDRKIIDHSDQGLLGR